MQEGFKPTSTTLSLMGRVLGSLGAFVVVGVALGTYILVVGPWTFVNLAVVVWIAVAIFQAVMLLR